MSKFLFSSFVVEDIAIEAGSQLQREAASLFRRMKVGQSFVAPKEEATRFRQAINRCFGTGTTAYASIDDNLVRVGKISEGKNRLNNQQSGLARTE